MRDFSNQTLQDEWNKFRTDVLSRRHERVQKQAAALQKQQAETQARQAQDQQYIQALQEKIEAMNAEFSDKSIALQYDTDRALQQSSNSTAVKPISHCLGERAHWIDCSTKYALDTRPCDAYLAALEACVKDTIIASTK